MPSFKCGANIQNYSHITSIATNFIFFKKQTKLISIKFTIIFTNSTYLINIFCVPLHGHKKHPKGISKKKKERYHYDINYLTNKTP